MLIIAEQTNKREHEKVIACVFTPIESTYILYILLLLLLYILYIDMYR